MTGILLGFEKLEPKNGNDFFLICCRECGCGRRRLALLVLGQDRGWAKEKMVKKLSTLTDVSARYMYMYIVSLETREALAFDERQARR